MAPEVYKEFMERDKVWPQADFWTPRVRTFGIAGAEVKELRVFPSLSICLNLIMCLRLD